MSISYRFLSQLLGEDLTVHTADNILPHVYLETWVDVGGMCCYLTSVSSPSPHTLRAVRIGATTAVATVSCEAILAALGKKECAGKYYRAAMFLDITGQWYMRIDFSHYAPPKMARKWF